MDFSDYKPNFKSLEDISEAEFTEEMRKTVNYIERITVEKEQMATLHSTDLAFYKTLMCNAYVNIVVCARKVMDLYPSRREAVEGALMIALGPISILLSGIVGAIAVERKAEENKDSSIPDIKGAWYDKPDRNSN